MFSNFYFILFFKTHIKKIKNYKIYKFKRKITLENTK